MSLPSLQAAKGTECSRLTAKPPNIRMEKSKKQLFLFVFPALLGILVYANSTRNQYVLDDEAVLTDNPHTLAGIKGIPMLLATDSFHTGFILFDEDVLSSGGRYRPLSLISFAIEIDLFKLFPETWTKNLYDLRPTSLSETNVRLCPAFSHGVNVLLFGLCCGLVAFFLRRWIFPNALWPALAGALIFAVHPIHTEVVANIKSRDEILGLILFILVFNQFGRWARSHRTGQLLFAMGLLFLALLAKEYALTSLILIPMGLWLSGSTLKRSSSAAVPIFATIVAYLALRFTMVGFSIDSVEDPLNNFYFVASDAPLAESLKMLATKFWCLGVNLKWLVYPYPLSGNYQFAAIGYTNFGDWTVWISILAYILIGIWGLVLLFTRNRLALAVFFFLGTLFMGSNLLMDLGTPLGERLLFHPSLGFCAVAGAAFGVLGLRHARLAQLLLLFVIVAGSWHSMLRNRDWYDNKTLFLKDVHAVPNSAMVQYNVGTYHYQDGNWDLAHHHLSESIRILPNFVKPYQTRCLVQVRRGAYAESIADFKQFKDLFPASEMASYANFIWYECVHDGIEAGKSGDAKTALKNFELAEQLISNAEIHRFIGGAHQELGNLRGALVAWKKSRDLDAEGWKAWEGFDSEPSRK